jgi:hypothetical protein
MTNRLPPVPPASRSPKEPGNQAEPPTSADRNAPTRCPRTSRSVTARATSSRTRPTRGTSRIADRGEGPQPLIAPMAAPVAATKTRPSPSPRRTSGMAQSPDSAERQVITGSRAGVASGTSTTHTTRARSPSMTPAGASVARPLVSANPALLAIPNHQPDCGQIGRQQLREDAGLSQPASGAADCDYGSLGAGVGHAQDDHAVQRRQTLREPRRQGRPSR